MQEIDSENAVLRVHLERAEKSLDLFREEKHHSDELVVSFVFCFQQELGIKGLSHFYRNFLIHKFMRFEMKKLLKTSASTN